jgi:class 3 adenylate cyclase
MTDLRQWLESIGLGQYADLFVRNDIDLDVLAEIDEQDLEKLGISFGHRKKLLKAILGYRGSYSTSPALRDEVQRLTAAAPIKPERRHLTILFCDLVGSTALSARLDPEDLRQILLEFQRCCSHAIRTFDGHIARFLGDGVLAYFGFPMSREGDAERSVNAALEILEEVSAIQFGQRLKVRVGIASGLVVAGDLIGEGSAAEFSLVGEAPNLAARIQALAAPNQILVSNSTRRLLGRVFHLADLGEHDIRGLDQSVRIWRVLGRGAVETRFEALRIHDLNPLIGREVELALLQDKCVKSAQGEGQLIMISGEPGIGKSRLAIELTQRLTPPYSLIYLQCSSHHTSSAWHPVIRYLERAAGITYDATPHAKLQKLQALISQWVTDAGETVALLAGLLSIPAESGYLRLELNPQQQKAERSQRYLIYSAYKPSSNWRLLY